MPYVIVRTAKGEVKPKTLRYKFNLRGEAEKMRTFLDQQIKCSLFQVMWVPPAEKTVNRRSA